MKTKKHDHWDAKDQNEYEYVVKRSKMILPYISALAIGLRVQVQKERDGSWVDVTDIPDSGYARYRVLPKNSTIPRRPKIRCSSGSGTTGEW